MSLHSSPPSNATIMDEKQQQRTHTVDGVTITVVVAVLNGKATIKRCLDSVLGQSYPGVELIVMDGCSSDGTIEMIKSYGDRIQYFESSPDTGIYDAWNKALRHVSGDWVLFLGSDDYLNGLHVLAEIATRLGDIGADVGIAYGRVRRTKAHSGTEDCVIGEPWEKASSRLWLYSPIPHQGTFHRRSLFVHHGPFDATFSIAGDYEFLLRELKDHPGAYIPEPVVSVMSDGGVSTSVVNATRILLELRRAQERHGHYQRPGFWLAAKLRAWAKMILRRVLGQHSGDTLLRRWRYIQGTERY